MTISSQTYRNISKINDYPAHPHYQSNPGPWPTKIFSPSCLDGVKGAKSVGAGALGLAKSSNKILGTWSFPNGRHGKCVVLWSYWKDLERSA